ncbi:hypothetical protein LNV47_22605 [Paucibacter sp. DJ4R-1]|nr:hypothetical protein [Paucibacter sp. DJ4R-1]
MFDLNAYAYQPPNHPETHPEQCYYRPAAGSNCAFPAQDDDSHRQRVRLFRFSSLLGVELELSTRQQETAASLSLTLSPAAMLRLRDALNDALTDIAAQQDLLDRQASLDAFMQEMRDNPEGFRSAYIVHPDVHYVAPGEAAAKMTATSGPCIVIEDAEMASLLAPSELSTPTSAAAAL